MVPIPRVFRITGACNNYPWGKKGHESLAAKLAERSSDNFVVKEDEPYSEIWFGDYPDFPARVHATGELLADMLNENRLALLGEDVLQNMDPQLPFLPKVLSIANALPLQIHPNKHLAEQLHIKDPEKFTDPNHKPEIAVALSKFEVFAGWKSLSDISSVFNVPSLRKFIPDGTATWTNETLREVTRGLLQASPETVAGIEGDLKGLSRKALEDLDHQGYIVDLLPRLQSQYEATDPGSLVALLCMNYLVLEPGQAIYIPADGIHAYLSGDIIECMARSNNVLNTGFCPRSARDDIDLFSDTLTFVEMAKDDIMLPARKSNSSLKGKTTVYRPPIGEFDMLRVRLGHQEDEELEGQRGPGVAIITEGEGTLVADGRKHFVRKGYVYFIGPRVPLLLETDNSRLEAYIAVV